MNKQVTIYCASSPSIPQLYFDAAKELTRLLIEAGYGIRYGGGGSGLMGVVADTTIALGGRITGVIPRFMIDVEWEHKGVRDMIRVNTMHQRKELLIKDTDAVIALPGGPGTLEELFEVVSWKKLGLFVHPVILLNTNHFYDPLLEMSKKMADESFTFPVNDPIWNVVNEPSGVLSSILETSPGHACKTKFASA